MGVGEDASTTRPAEAVAVHPSIFPLPGLSASRVLDGRGHRVRQERPGTVGRLPTNWSASIGG